MKVLGTFTNVLLIAQGILGFHGLSSEIYSEMTIIMVKLQRISVMDA